MGDASVASVGGMGSLTHLMMHPTEDWIEDAYLVTGGGSAMSPGNRTGCQQRQHQPDEDLKVHASQLINDMAISEPPRL